MTDSASHRARIARLQQAITGAGLDGLLVSTPSNVRYLTGYDGSNGLVCVGRDGARLVTDFRYQEAVEPIREILDVEIAGRDILADVAADPAARFGGGTSLGFEAGHLAFARARQLLDGDGATWEPSTGLVEGLRIVKDAAEVAFIRAACEPLAEAYRTLAREGIVGRTETDVAWRIQEVIHEAGYANTFAIVGGGPNGALPHGRPGARVIERGDLVVVDIGATGADGYQSDCTRTLAAGAEPTPEARADYEVVLAAQRAGVAAARAGVVCGDVDAAARAVIDAAGIGELFGHGLGHGVGLDVHESPYFRKDGTEIGLAGAVMSVEPGIYRPGKWGIRVEDLVALHDGGCDVLTGGFPTELVVTDG